MAEALSDTLRQAFTEILAGSLAADLPGGTPRRITAGSPGRAR